MMNDVQMESFQDNSNDAVSQIKGEYFYGEDSNIISVDSSKFELNDENSLSNLGNNAEDGGQSQDGSERSFRSCYCGKERNLDVIELQCARCFRWCHEACITIKLDKVIRFMTAYTFFCKLCTLNNMESFTRRQSNFKQICQTALANLMQTARKNGDENFVFSKNKEIIPFIEKHWDYLSNQSRRLKNTWHNTVTKTMMKDSDTFLFDNRDPDDILFALRERDCTKIAPNYGKVKYHGLESNDSNQNGFGKGDNFNLGAARSSRGVKKKLGNHYQDFESSDQCKKQKCELTQPKLPPCGFPIEYPLNKDNYRYFLAEPDFHAPGKNEYEESQDYGAGKPIPPWLFRRLMPENVALSMHDRAQQLKLSDDRRTVIGDKGYTMLRASNGVTRGIWYYEIKINDMPDKSATRIGWAQELANLQTPPGCDKLSYSWRSRKGTKFHQSIGRHFADEGFGVGDVLGCLIHLPHELDEKHWSEVNDYRPFLPKSYKEYPLIKFKSFHYYEEKDESIKSAETKLTPLPGSKIVYYKNGQKIGTAFENIYNGIYYPAAGLYKNISITFNFGPDFEYPLTDPEYEYRYKGMHEVIFESQVEQSLSDVIYLVENESNLVLDKFYENYNKGS